MKTYMYIQVAYPIIMKQNWRGGAEAGGGGGGGRGWRNILRYWSTNEKLALFKRTNFFAKVIKHNKVK